MFVSMVLSFGLLWAFQHSKPGKTNHLFRRLQLVSAAAYSLGHGANDAQKTMGIIFVALVSTKHLQASDAIPLWVVLSCHGAMAIGTLLGGWRIVKTMGSKITHLTSFQGFSAETAGAITLFSTSALGIPVSTTPHHCRSHHGRRRHPTVIGGEVGHYQDNFYFLGYYDTCNRYGCCCNTVVCNESVMKFYV